MTHDKATIAYYDGNAPRYSASMKQDRHRHLDPFLDQLSANAEILEIGCGAGQDAAHMVSRGFTVDATDGAPAMVCEANRRFNLDARIMRFDELTACESYDAVWAHACLLHLPRQNVPDVLARIYRALKPGGWHFANFKLGDEDHPDEGRDPLGRWANLPDKNWLRDKYAGAGFELITEDEYVGNGSDGVIRDWCALTVRKL